jgi:hypothetical protein
MRLSFVCVLALGATSCFAVTNLDRFSQSGGASGNFSDLKLSVRGMTSHVNEYFEYRVIDATGTIQSRGISLPLGGVDATLFAVGAVPKLNGPFHLDFYADHDHNGVYTPPTGDTFPDHGWRIDLKDPNDQGVIEVSFDHNTSFANLIDPAPKEFGTPSVVHLVNLGGLQGKRAEVRVFDASTKRTVALYRVPSIAAPTVDAKVPGMIEEDVNYAIEVYTDDGNAPDARPTGVVSYRFEKAADAKGLDATFDPATAPVVTDAPAP